jgi:hypothetical protein
LEEDSEDVAFSFGDDMAAWSHFEAKILDGGPIGLSAYGHYSLTDPLYQQLGSSDGLVPLEAGEKMAFGGTIDFGPFEFSPSHSVVSDAAHKTEKLAGTIAFGSHSVTLSQDTTVSFDEDGAWTTRRRAHNASFDVGFLNMEFMAVGLSVITFDRVVDTVALARSRFPGREARSSACPSTAASPTGIPARSGTQPPTQSHTTQSAMAAAQNSTCSYTDLMRHAYPA